jgi:hypothetical protein
MPQTCGRWREEDTRMGRVAESPFLDPKQP